MRAERMLCLPTLLTTQSSLDPSFVQAGWLGVRSEGASRLASPHNSVQSLEQIQKTCDSDGDQLMPAQCAVARGALDSRPRFSAPCAVRITIRLLLQSFFAPLEQLPSAIPRVCVVH